MPTPKNILITGMSATGKSSAIQELAHRGYRAVDGDDGFSEPGPEGDWLWIEPQVAALLENTEGGLLFFAGCATNQGRFYSRFHRVILLIAPIETLLQRLQARTTNRFGKSHEDQARILADIQTFEPILRRTSHAVLDTQAPLTQVVDQILAIANAPA